MNGENILMREMKNSVAEVECETRIRKRMIRLVRMAGFLSFHNIRSEEWIVKNDRKLLGRSLHAREEIEDIPSDLVAALIVLFGFLWTAIKGLRVVVRNGDPQVAAEDDRARFISL